MNVIKAACIQMTSGPEIEANLEHLEQTVRQAAADGAQFVATPENSDAIRFPPSPEHKALPADEHPGIPRASALAKELGIHLLIGSFRIGLENGKKANRSHFFGPDGALISTYDKIHLFDVHLPSGESHKESDIYQGGDKAVVVDLPGAKLGLSICYDVRFAYLYRDLAKAGAQIFAVPSAFTVPTGRAHWETLLRARAIETGSFVVAPAQVGDHEGGRRTYGHSMIISPWGEILAKAESDASEIIHADIRLDHVRKARESIPALTHDREYELD
ncbi:MAG: carbon-nitrogen hydrolase family protein [Pseudomonadota bacterium]